MKTLYSLLVAGVVCLSAGLSQAEDGGKLTVADLTFSYPSPWTAAENASPMRAGTLTYAMEGADKPLEAIFYYFGAGQGGDVEANVSRWIGQFQGTPEVKREEVAAGDKKVTIVKANGTYMDGPMFGQKTPKDGYTLLGAIVPAADANIFIKLTGPKDQIAKVAESFTKLVTSPFAK